MNIASAAAGEGVPNAITPANARMRPVRNVLVRFMVYLPPTADGFGGTV